MINLVETVNYAVLMNGHYFRIVRFLGYALVNLCIVCASPVHLIFLIVHHLRISESNNKTGIDKK